jgi:hypothetical protein
MYSQNHEDDIILMYFKSKVYPLEIAKHEFTLLEIGANDGKTFSNSLRLIEAGFKAVLVARRIFAHVCRLNLPQKFFKILRL